MRLEEDGEANGGEDEDGHEDADHVDDGVLEDGDFDVHELPPLHPEYQMPFVFVVVLVALLHALDLGLLQQLAALREAEGPGVVAGEAVLVPEDAPVVGEEGEAVGGDLVLSLVEED